MLEKKKKERKGMKDRYEMLETIKILNRILKATTT